MATAELAAYGITYGLFFLIGYLILYRQKVRIYKVIFGFLMIIAALTMTIMANAVTETANIIYGPVTLIIITGIIAILKEIMEVLLRKGK